MSVVKISALNSRNISKGSRLDPAVRNVCVEWGDKDFPLPLGVGLSIQQVLSQQSSPETRRWQMVGK